MKASRASGLEVPGYITGILQAENRKKWTNLNQYISINTDIDEKWFVIFKHTFNHLSFGYAHLAQLEYYFSLFLSFFLLHYHFFFLFPSYLLLNYLTLRNQT